MSESDTRLTKLVSGALKDTINVHGPVTKELLTSATKRIVGQLRHHVILVDEPTETEETDNDDTGIRPGDPEA